MIGIIIGSIFFGQLSDSFGRKWPLIICLTGTALSGFMSSFANGLLSFTICRATALFFSGGQTAISMVFFVENIPKKDRMWLNSVVSWSPNFAFLAIAAYFSYHWRTLANVVGLLTLPAIAMSLFMFESPQWLVRKGKLEKANKVIRQIIRFNGRPKLSAEEIAEVISKEKENAAVSASKENFFIQHLFCTKQLIVYTVLVSFSYISTSIINYALFFNMAKVPGSVYTNNIVVGFTRWGVNASVGFVDYKVKCFGRKLLHGISLAFILVAIAIVFSLTHFAETGQYSTIIRISILITFVMVSHVYIVNNVTTNELYPTPIRNIAFSFVQVVSRIGVAIAPQLFVLAEHWDAFPYLVMFLLAGCDMMLFQFLIPETKGQPLKDSMPPAEDRLFGSVRKHSNLLDLTVRLAKEEDK